MELHHFNNPPRPITRRPDRFLSALGLCFKIILAVIGTFVVWMAFAAMTGCSSSSSAGWAQTAETVARVTAQQVGPAYVASLEDDELVRVDRAVDTAIDVLTDVAIITQTEINARELVSPGSLSGDDAGCAQLVQAYGWWKCTPTAHEFVPLTLGGHNDLMNYLSTTYCIEGQVPWIFTSPCETGEIGYWRYQGPIAICREMVIYDRFSEECGTSYENRILYYDCYPEAVDCPTP